jgi:hypothetical protein
MNRKAPIFSLLAIGLVALSGCSSAPPAGEAKKAAPKVDKIQGRVQVFVDPGLAGDADLNGGGSTLRLWQNKRQYRLFTRKTMELVHDNQYVVEGINAQKVIEEIGDPDQGKKGYPLRSSCERVVKMAWSGLPFDEVDVKAAVLKARVSRYPARTVFLVTKLRPATAEEIAAAPKETPKEEDLPSITVPAAKQRALLIEGPTTQTAPLWEPAGKTVSCKLIIDTKGKVLELETGAQLCEIVDWSKFSYKPTLQAGKPINVKTEVEVVFEPRK